MVAGGRRPILILILGYIGLISWDWHLILPPKSAMPNYLTCGILAFSHTNLLGEGENIFQVQKRWIFSNRGTGLYVANVRNQEIKHVRRRENTFFKLELTIQTIYDDNSQGGRYFFKMRKLKHKNNIPACKFISSVAWPYAVNWCNISCMFGYNCLVPYGHNVQYNGFHLLLISLNWIFICSYNWVLSLINLGN